MTLVFVLMILLRAGTAEDPLRGTVTAVTGGDVVSVMTDDGLYVIRLRGIDCPEPEQPYGPEAQEFAASWLMKEEVEVYFAGKDRQGNHVGVVALAGRGDVRIALLEAGLAWTGEKEPEKDLEAVRCEAVASARGLWQDPSPVPPWVFRRKQSMAQPKSR